MDWTLLPYAIYDTWLWQSLFNWLGKNRLQPILKKVDQPIRFSNKLPVFGFQLLKIALGGTRKSACGTVSRGTVLLL